MTTTCNGWSNYETWAVNLWLSNDQDRLNRCLALTATTQESAPTCEQVRGGIWTPAETCTFLLGAKLKELVEQHNPLADSPSVFADLVASALDNVDWQEIAREFLGLSDPDPEPQFLERSIP